ncbi:MAG: hypothetical protein RR630_07495 [Coprobacillus sp.]
MKKILLSLLLVLTLFLPISQVSAIGENGIGKVTNKKTPTDVSQVTDVKSLYAGFGADPVLYGDYLYTVKTGWGSTVAELLQINKKTMKVEKNVKLIAQAGGYTPFISAGDGQIFVPLCDGRVQAFDAKTLVSTWVSESVVSSDVGSRLTYHEGYLYYGIGGGSLKQGDPFICVSTKDEDTSKQNETKKITWSYNQGAGYYWAEAVIIGDSIAFVGYDGKLVLHDLTSNQVYDKVDLGMGAFTNSITYDSNSKKILAASKQGFVATINVDGHDLKENTLKKTQKFSQISSSPVSYNGRIYVAGGSGMDSEGKASSFTVFDINTLEVIYVNDKIAGQCIPVLSTAYATEENNQEVQLYMVNFSVDSNGQTNLYHITDNAENMTSIYQSLYKLDSEISGKNWNGSLIMDDNAFYAYNGNGTIVRFGFDTSIQTIRDENLIASQLNKDIAALPSLDNVSIKTDTQLEKIASTYSRLSAEAKKTVKNIEVIDQLQTIVKQQNTYINKLNDDITNKLNIYYLSQEDETLVNNLMNQYQKIHEVNKTLITQYKDVLSAKKIIDQLKNGVIPKDVFENIFQEDIDYTVTGTTGSLKYSFTFNGQDLINTNPFTFKVNTLSPLDNQIKKYAKNAFVLDFEFEGTFPGKATFEMETTLLDGVYALYYFNEKTNQIEFMQNVTIKNGMASMQLTHASTYFISEKLDLNKINKQIKNDFKAVGTNDGTDFIWPIIGLVVAAGAFIIVMKRTKKK